MTIDLGEETVSAPTIALQNALIEFTGCISDALPDICSVGFTLGESYVPFDPDPDEKCAREAECSQAWVRVMSVQPLRMGPDSFEGDVPDITLSLELEVGILRCIKTPAKGKAPYATDVLIAGMQALTDMRAILCAALACDVWEDTLRVGQWFPQGPLGGQHGGTWTFQANL